MSCWAQDTLDAFIHGWLSSIENSPSQSKLATRRAAVIESPRKKANRSIIPSPPPSSTHTNRRSPKRQRINEEAGDVSEQQTPDDVFFDTDKTPSALNRSLILSTVNPPARPFPQTHGSGPSTASSARSQSRTSRSSSPVKRSTLQLLKKPVHYVPIEDDPTTQLPEDILPTYDRIVDITVHHTSFLPRAVEDEVIATHRRNMIKPYMFFDHDGDESLAQHKRELETLRDIEKAANECQTEEACEAAWNLEVHGPLLKLALDPFPSLSRHILTHARISKPFVPEMRDESAYDFTRTKIVDWGVRIDPSEETSSRLYEMIDRLPFNERSVNQTTYGPVRYCPIAISIETKIAIGALEEARLQLGVWTAAWHKRMRLLLNDAESSDNTKRIITLPLVLILEHEWRLLFACDRGHRIVRPQVLLVAAIG